MSKILKLKPFFSERLWGGRKLEEYGFKLPDNNLYGEAWLISALENGMTHLENDQSFKSFFEENKTIFNNEKEYPLLTKIITANNNLSVQVHPDDDYAIKKHNMLGKPECWYVIDCPDDAELIYGHHAKDQNELKTLVNDKLWDKLFQKIKIKKGDFIYVPPGKIHAITKGVTVFELQRSSDITYRFYDYDRLDKNNQLRELHINDCLNVTTVPDHEFKIDNIANGKLIDNAFFTLYVLTKDQSLHIKNNWVQINSIEGSTIINQHKINAGESALIYNFDNKLDVQTDGKIFLSYKK